MLRTQSCEETEEFFGAGTSGGSRIVETVASIGRAAEARAKLRPADCSEIGCQRRHWIL